MGFLSTVTAMSHVVTGFVDTVTGMSWKTHDAPSHGRYVKKTHATTHNHAGPVWLRVGNITLKDEEKSILYLTNAWLNGCIPKNWHHLKLIRLCNFAVINLSVNKPSLTTFLDRVTLKCINTWFI